METFLLVSIPPKRKFKRLRLAITEVSQEFLKSPSFPDTVGLSFWPLSLTLLKPISNRSKISTRHLVATADLATSRFLWPYRSHENLGESMSYQWRVSSRSTGRLIRDSSDFSRFMSPGSQLTTTKFTFGKGTFQEDILLVVPNFRQDLDNSLLPQVVGEFPEGFEISYDHSASTISVRTDLQMSSQLSTIDTGSWGIIGSSEPDDWFTYRLSGILRMQNPIQGFQSLTDELSTLFSEKCCLLSNLTRSVSRCPQDFEGRSILQDEINSLISWLNSSLKHVAGPLGSVLNDPKHVHLVKSHGKDIDCEVYRDIDWLRVNPRETFITHYTLRKLLTRYLHQLISLQAGRPDPVTKQHSDIDDPEYSYLICADLHRVLQNWVVPILKDPDCSGSLLRCLKDIKLSKSQRAILQEKSCRNIETIKLIHDWVLAWVNSTVRKHMAGFGRKVFIPQDDFNWKCIESLDEHSVIEMARSEYGQLLLFIKSISKPYQPHLLHIQPDGQQSWYQIPDSFDGPWINNPGNQIFVDSFLTPRSIWLIKQYTTNRRTFSVLRVNLAEVSTRAHPSIQFTKLGEFQCRGRDSILAFDHALIFTTEDECFRKLAEQARPANHANDPCGYLAYIGAHTEGKSLSAPTVLRDESPQRLIDEMRCYLPPGHTKSRKIFSCRDDQSLFIKYKCSKTPEIHHTCPPKQTISLQLFSLSISHKSYRLLQYGKWTIGTLMGRFLDSDIDIRTMKLGNLHYCLLISHDTRVLIGFDMRQMLLVLIDGQPVHQVLPNIGNPMTVQGFGGSKDYGIYIKQETPELSPSSRFTLHRVRYTF